MGRAPCCDKANVKKGPWSPEEDAKLKSYIEQHGTGGNWIALPQKIGLKRCGKSCRLRWLNYLRPNIKHGGFSEEEDNIICSLYISIGSRWSVIAAQLPGRTDNDIKNYWNTRLKKKLLGKHRKEQEARNNKRNGVVKQESDSSSLLQENSTTQQQEQPYWPQINIPMAMLPPLPYTSQTPSFNDQDSIRKLLIKLGGRFSDDYYDQLNFQFPNSSLVSTQEVHEEQVHVGSSCMINNNNNNEVQFNEYCADLVQGQGGNLISLIGETVSTNNYYYPQRLSTGLEFLYGEDHMMIDNKVMCTNWTETETNSLMYPSLVASNYEAVKQEMPQESDFQGYQGAQ